MRVVAKAQDQREFASSQVFGERSLVAADHQFLRHQLAQVFLAFNVP
jgi:hypothetical protein